MATLTIDRPLDEYKRNELFAFAAKLGISTTQRDTKPELIEKLQDVVRGNEPEQDPTSLASPTAYPINSASYVARNAPTRIVRPSDVENAILARLRQDHPRASDEEIQSLARDVDRFRFVRDEGLPAPRRRYRVTARRSGSGGVHVIEPTEVDAVDEGEAKSMVLDQHLVKNNDRHHWAATVVLLEE